LSTACATAALAAIAAPSTADVAAADALAAADAAVATSDAAAPAALLRPRSECGAMRWQPLGIGVRSRR